MKPEANSKVSFVTEDTSKVSCNLPISGRSQDVHQQLVDKDEEIDELKAPCDPMVPV